jgi:TFIIIC subunit triple barrel domain
VATQSWQKCLLQVQNVDTPAPRLAMPNGTEFICKYEQSMGTNMIMQRKDEGATLDLVGTSNIVLKATNPAQPAQPGTLCNLITV